MNQSREFHKLFAAVCAGWAFFSFAAEFQVLETAQTEMCFRKDGGVWYLDHYGAKGVSAADAAALAYHPGDSRSSDCKRRPTTLSVFGDRAFDCNPNRYGGLAVTHADGVVSTELVAGETVCEPGADGSRHLVFKLKDAAYDFTVDQHFVSRPDCDVIETWLEIRNGEKGDVRLGRMDSVALTFPNGSTGDARLMTLSSDWGNEGNLSITPVTKGKTVSSGMRTGIHVLPGNPSFMLWRGDEVGERSGEVLGGVLCWTGSHRVSVECTNWGGLEVLLGVDNVAGAYVLAPGRKITTPKAALTWSRRGRGQVSRNFHRWARNHRLPHGRDLRDILLNSWEGSYFSFTEKTLVDMMDGVRQLGGELFVVDDGWFGKGEFARDDKNRDKVGLGDWVVNPEKLPRGLGYLTDEAKKLGLGFGIWVEPEMVSSRSALGTAHPEWMLREPTRPVYYGRGKTETVLDYTNPAVRDNISAQLEALLASVPELRYMKWDANANICNFGCEGLARDRQANLWFDYTTGLYDVLARMRAKHPNLVIQACSGGGGHMDYGFLGYADEFWTSDDTDAYERVFIQWGASQFYPASAMGAHVTVVPNHQTKRTTPFKYRFDVAMSGRLGFELHPKDLSAEEVAFAQKAVAAYKRIRPVVQQGDLYRLDSPIGGDHAALMYANEKGTKAVLFVYGLLRRCGSPAVNVRLDGLDPSRRYRLTEINRWGKDGPHIRANGKTVSGAALMEKGLFVKLGHTLDSCVVELEAIE